MIKNAIFTQAFPPFNVTLRGLQDQNSHQSLVKALLSDAETLTCMWGSYRSLNKID